MFSTVPWSTFLWVQQHKYYTFHCSVSMSIKYVHGISYIWICFLLITAVWPILASNLYLFCLHFNLIHFIYIPLLGLSLKLYCNLWYFYITFHHNLFRWSTFLHWSIFIDFPSDFIYTLLLFPIVVFYCCYILLSIFLLLAIVLSEISIWFSALVSVLLPIVLDPLSCNSHPILLVQFYLFKSTRKAIILIY